MRHFFPLFLLTLLSLSACQKDEPAPLPQLVSDAAMSHSKHTILLEPTVSVNCGACPLAHHEVEEIEANYNNVTHMSHDLFGPLSHPYTSYLMDKINKTVYTPLLHVSRRHEDGSVVCYPVNMTRGIVDLVRRDSTAVSLSIETMTQESDMQIEVKVLTDAQDLQKELALTVILVEKEVVGEGSGYDQRNYGNDDEDHPYYQQGDWIQGFKHTNVIRYVLTPNEGELIDLESGSFDWTTTVSLSELDQSPEAYRVIAFVNENSDIVEPILNAAVAELSE